MSDKQNKDVHEDSPGRAVPPPVTPKGKKSKGNGEDVEAEANGEGDAGLPPDGEEAAPAGTAPASKKAKVYKPPSDAADLTGLFVDTGQGDPLTETIIHAIAVDKPKDFFRVHPDPAYRRRCYVYTLKVEGVIEEFNYIVAESMRDLVPEAKLCLVTTCIYRNGTLRLWLLKLPKEGEKDQMAWSTARAAAKDALTKWTKIVWVGSKYNTRSAVEGYAPDPDISKIPPFERLVELAFGAHGVMRDESHPVYREQILGAAAEKSGDDLA
jgi:hypothetical protein